MATSNRSKREAEKPSSDDRSMGERLYDWLRGRGKAGAQTPEAQQERDAAFRGRQGQMEELGLKKGGSVRGYGKARGGKKCKMY